MKKSISFIFASCLSLAITQTCYANQNSSADQSTRVDALTRKVDAGDKQALSELEKTANSGNVQAQYHLGLYYGYRDEKIGLNWFRLAANQGHCDSLVYLGSYYRDTSLVLSLAIEKLAIDNAEQSGSFRNISSVKNTKSNWPIRYEQLKKDQQTTMHKLVEEIKKPNNFLKAVDKFLSQK